MLQLIHKVTTKLGTVFRPSAAKDSNKPDKKQKVLRSDKLVFQLVTTHMMMHTMSRAMSEHSKQDGSCEIRNQEGNEF